MKWKTLTKTEKLNEAREKRLKEDLSPRGKTEPVGKTYKYVGLLGRRFIDLNYVCQQLEDGCKVKKEISLAYYEDETVIGLIKHITYNLYTSQFYCMIRYMLFRSENLL